MYAFRRLHVKQWKHQRPEERYKVQIEYGGKPVKGIRADRISNIEEEVMYWHKAYHIHAWFVDNMQDGRDDCESYYVGGWFLCDLLDVCRKVIKASKLVEGEVWASTTYDKDHPNGIDQWQSGKVIEDPSVARQLLKMSEVHVLGSKRQYDEDYLKDVIVTRDWAERMMEDEANGVPGEIYYSSIR